jgi:hypothetical protein
MASQLEFDTVLHVLEKHLPPNGTVLDLAERGVYSPSLAQRGFKVVSPDNGDVTRLELLSDRNFQAVLCLGPYCGLRSRDQRRRCLLECRRVLGDGGIVALLYLNRAFALGMLVRDGVPLTEAQYRSLYFQLETDETPAFDDAYLTSPEDVETEVRSCGYTVVEHVGADGIYDYFPGAFSNLSTEAYQDFLWYHLRTCGQPSSRGHSRHGLVILRKA